MAHKNASNGSWAANSKCAKITMDPLILLLMKIELDSDFKV